MMQREDSILVSVIVITYNSAQFVIETLESIKDQSYKNIELIISDDASKDDTVSLCKEWLEKNKNRFVSTTMLTVPSNTGISENCERGVLAAKGQWIKFIAGDDCLSKDCILSFVDYVTQNDVDFVVSDMYAMDENSENIRHYENKIDFKYFFSLPIHKQYKYFLYTTPFFNAPAMFFKCEPFRKNVIIDTKYKLLEDQPILINMLKNNCKGGFLDKPLVYYRISSSSISSGFSKNFRKNLLGVFDEYRRPVLVSSRDEIKYSNLLRKKMVLQTKYDNNAIVSKIALKIFAPKIERLSQKLIKALNSEN